ncbi:hypothetical protein J4214_05725 [Candidatus Woesearchaeota archaeon]|nr:hypothetical protein [Candidatus Woesearchaeota archaeon]
MEETIKINKQLMDNIRILVKKSKMFNNEQDFIEQAIIKQMSRLKDL